jgi:hypothetical protein
MLASRLISLCFSSAALVASFTKETTAPIFSAACCKFATSFTFSHFSECFSSSLIRSGYLQIRWTGLIRNDSRLSPRASVEFCIC